MDSGWAESGPLRHEDRRRFRDLFVEQATSSFLKLSFGMGVVAFLLPIALLATAGYAGNYSISWFYHAGEVSRNIFVGGLWAAGVFLILFRGLSRVENGLLNAAGLFGIVVAMVPMSGDQCSGMKSEFNIHAASAILFFLCLAIVAVGFSKERISFIVNPKVRRRFKAAYNITGVVMILAPASVAAVHVLSRGGCENHWIFWIETSGIWAFSAYWFTKTIEYRVLLGARFSSPRAIFGGNAAPD